MFLLLGTRKGLVIFERHANGFKKIRSCFDGIPVVFACKDPNTGDLWASLEHGHWGGKLGRSSDMGQTWDAIEAPVYPKGATYRAFSGDDKPASYEFTWCIGPGGKDEPGTLYFGTNPGGLFVTRNNGDSFELVQSLWDEPGRSAWFGGGKDTPGFSNVLVDPDNSAHVYAAVSCGGVYFSADHGKSFQRRNRGLKADFLPDPEADVGHDPHCIDICAANRQVIWQQNHCGIFRSVNGAETWDEVSQQDVGAHFGWVVCADAKDPDTAWFVPAQGDEKRMAYPEGLFVLKTTDGGRTFVKMTHGLPTADTYDIVYRHGAALQDECFVFGTTTGNVYFTTDGGNQFVALGHNFAPVSSVRFAD